MGGKWTIGDGLEDNWFIGDDPGHSEWPELKEPERESYCERKRREIVEDLKKLDEIGKRSPKFYKKIITNKNLSGLIKYCKKYFHSFELDYIFASYILFRKKYGLEETEKIFLEKIRKGIKPDKQGSLPGLRIKPRWSDEERKMECQKFCFKDEGEVISYLRHLAKIYRKDILGEKDFINAP